MARSALAQDALASLANGWGKRNAVERQVMLANILAEVSSEALQGDSLETVLKGIVDCIIERLPVTVASIILLDESNDYFIEEVWSGHIDLALPGGLPWAVELGAAGRCVRTRQPQLITDVSNDPDYIPGNSQVCSEYLEPIQHRGVLHGVLNLESTNPEFFTSEVSSVFDAIALQIAGAVHLATVVRELEVANRTLLKLSMSDGLTGIANRRCFDGQLKKIWDHQFEISSPLSLLLVDIDCFKLINDSFGHQHGDECLRMLARHCAEQFNADADLVARYGGEEFAIILPGRDLAAARRTAHKLRQSIIDLAIEHPASPVARVITASIGVGTVRPTRELDCDALVRAADKALYLAKDKGRNATVARSVSQT